MLSSAPDALRITFSEPVSLLGPGIRILSPSGKRADQPPAQVNGDQASVALDAGEQGTYVVQWQVMSEDTHPARGQFAFSVGEPSKPAISSQGLNVGEVTPLGLALQGLARWLHFGAYALAFGALGFALLTRVLITPAVSRLTNAGIILLLLAEPLALLGQTASLGLDQMLDGDVMGDALGSSFGRLMGFRIAAALLLWVITGSLRPTPGPTLEAANRSFPKQPPAAVVAALALGAALAVIDAFGQHAASFQPEALGLIIHALHLMATALWLGGLAVILTNRFQISNPKPQIPVVGAALATSAVTGLAMAFVHIQSPAALPFSTYGQILGIKQLFVLLAVACGSLAIRGKQRGWLLGEAGALLCLIALAGLLVSLPPPH